MGWLQQVVVASEVIITTTGGDKVIVIDPTLEAELFYFPSEGAGNLIMSLAAQAGTDAFGNTFPQGLHLAVTPVSLPAMINGWTLAGHARYIIDPLGNLQVSFKDLGPGGTFTDGTPIFPAGSVPAPHDTRRVACYANPLGVVGAEGSETVGCPALEFQTDGSIQCFGIVAATNRVDLFATIPLSF